MSVLLGFCPAGTWVGARKPLFVTRPRRILISAGLRTQLVY